MKKMYYRVFQFCMKIAMYFLPWREPFVIDGDDSAVLKLPSFLLSKGRRNVLIITDSFLMSNGFIDRLIEALKEKGLNVKVYDKVVPNPTTDNVEEAVMAYKEINADCMIAFGGGSPMDCAKACGARIARPKKSVQKMKGVLKVLRKIPMLIAIPTTAGTGSETTLAAVITDSKTHHKYAINDIFLIPYAAVLDPQETLSLPKHITSTTGMDTLCHAVEAYIGKSNTKKTKESAREAVRLVDKYLYKAYMQPSDIEARANMQRAAYLGGLAFTRAYVGYVHAIAHTLGGQYSLPHGLGNAIILPYVLKAYGKSVHKPLSELADIINLCHKNSTMEVKSDKFIEYIEELNKKMQIPNKIDVIKAEDIDIMANFALKEGNPLYPVPQIFDIEEFKKIYKDLML